MFTSKTGLIIPTRNRPKELYSTLDFLSKKKIKFFKTVIIDSSDKNLKKEIIKICNKFRVKLYFSNPSTSKQRNIGLKKLIKNKLEFIMFLDDDLKFYKNSFNCLTTNSLVFPSPNHFTSMVNSLFSILDNQSQLSSNFESLLTFNI